MDTVKEEALGIMKQLRRLRAERVPLNKEFRKQKELNASLRAELEQELAQYEVRAHTHARACAEVSLQAGALGVVPAVAAVVRGRVRAVGATCD